MAIFFGLLKELEPSVLYQLSWELGLGNVEVEGRRPTLRYKHSSNAR